MLLCTCTNVTEISGVYWDKLILVCTLCIQNTLQLAYVQKAYPKHLIYRSLFGVYCFPEMYEREENCQLSD